MIRRNSSIDNIGTYTGVGTWHACCPVALACTALGRLLSDALSHLRRSYHSLITNYPSLLHKLSCPLPPPHLPRSPTLCLFSTLHWNPTNGRQRRIWPRIRSFPSFNPAIPPRQSSPSFEIKSPHSANPKMVTMDSQNGSPRR